MPSIRTNTILQRLKAVLTYVGLPLMFFVAGAGLFFVLGLMQRFGWISAGGGPSTGSASAAADVEYICPMMCVPPVKEPGRCPVCAMELVPATGNNAGGDERSIIVDPASRRIANIQTVSVKTRSVDRTIRSVGELQYDEGSLKTITAYSGGRIERLFVDYTGAVVEKGDRLAFLYSPQLHAAQVEFLQTAKMQTGSSRLQAVAEANRLLQLNARQKLVELGMSETQIATLERNGKPDSRLDILAPLAGTVINRMVSQGQTVKDGEPLFQLADLSSVWLMLELFPQDAAAVRYGQRVDATLKSIPGETFSGRIAFVDPDVDPKTRTVNVRVVIDNSDGRLRIGDYARAEIVVPVGGSDRNQIYDPELASKWISPRHPHIVSDKPGQCPLCGDDLIAASKLGFTDTPPTETESLVVPRNAVLQAAGHSVTYVEEEPGRFAIRRVITGATVGDEIVIEQGLAADEKIATRGNFLLDSQMQLAGNPSLIDPTRAAEPLEMIAGFDVKMLAAIQMLPDADQPLALEQVICPVTKFKLGSMGVPPKVSVAGNDIYLCCEGCRDSLMEDPQSYITMLETMKAEGTLHEAESEDAGMPELPDIGAIGDIEAIDDSGLPPIGEMQLVPPPGNIESTDSTKGNQQ